MNSPGPGRRSRRALGLAYLAVLSLAVTGAAALGGRTPAVAAAPPDGPAAPRRTDRQRLLSLVTADRLVNRNVDGEPITYLYGNVYLDRDTVTVRADSAHVFRDRNLVRLFGDVRLRQFESRLAARWGEYRHDRGEADFAGDVRVWDQDVLATSRLGEMRDEGQLLRLFDNAVLITPEYTVRADTILRDRRLDYGQAQGDVRIVDPRASTLVTGDRGFFANDGSWAEVNRRPVLVSQDEGGQPVHSEARVMRFYRQEERVVMTDSVRIRQGQTRARADTAVSYGRSRMVLWGAPEVAMGDESRMTADVITFLFGAGKLQRMILVGSARMEDTGPDSLAAEYPGLPAMDVIEGDSVTIRFAGGEIDRTVVVGRASSVYVPVDVEDEIAYNEVRGDTLTIIFRDDRVHTVDVRGNMQGTYHFASVKTLRGEVPADSTAADSTAAAPGDSLLAAGDSLAVLAAPDTVAVARADSLAAAARDSLALAAATDSLAARQGDLAPTVYDSLLTAMADSLARAAAAAAPSRKYGDLAETVQYSGHGVTFDLPAKTIDITGDGELVYGAMRLKAQDVKLNTGTRELYAAGEPYLEDNETIVGERMGYDFGNKTGAVCRGVTTFDGYYYVGEEIERFPDGSLKIHSGKMTSCDLARPHYHFWSDRMKMKLGDEVVATPIVLKVGEVPLFALPFFFRSLKEGRRSGILFPNFNFGWSQRDGRYIRDFGYYWATNDYMDFVFEGDWNERRELTGRVHFNYNVRYSFDGYAEYSRREGLDNDTSEWQLRAQHSQPKLFDDYRLRADVSMASRTLSRNDLSRDTGRDIINGELKSTLYLSRNWDLVNASVNLQRKEKTNATDADSSTNNEIWTMQLPSLTLGFKQFALAPTLRPGQKGSFLGELGRQTYFSQNYSLNRNERERETTHEVVTRAQGSWSLRVRPPRIGPLNVSFGSSASQAWERREFSGRVFVPETVDEDSVITPGYYAPLDSIYEETDPGLSLDASAGTTLYGIFPLRVGPLRAIRHTLTLSTGASWRPGIPGEQVQSSSYSFRVGNRFDVKYASSGGPAGAAASDSTEKFQKLDGVIDWSLNTSYNPDAPPDRRWSTISSSLDLRPGRSRNLAIRVNQSIDPYALALLSTRLNYGFSFRGRLDTGALRREREERRNDAIDRLGLAPTDTVPVDSLLQQDDLLDDPSQGIYQGAPYGDDPTDQFYEGYEYAEQRAQRTASGKDPTEGGRFIPWTLGGSLSYSYDNNSGATTSRASINVSTNLTRDWEFRYSASFDLDNNATTRQEYRLQRDLHCWRLEFNRIVSNVDSQFGFRFYLKAIPELKLTQGREDMMGGVSSLSGGFLP